MQQRLRLSANIVAGMLLTWFLLLPVNVQALGFGNINMRSALNEPLNAEIELLSATPEDIKNLEVKLASREAFLRAGVDRSALLSQIKFDIAKRGGKYYVTLSTQESVREPFLNFLLEMNWKSGRMLREYTMLLDPPDRVQRQVARAPETTPAEVTAPAPEPMPAPEPAVLSAADQPLAPEPAPAKVESPFLDAPAPAPVTATADDQLYPAIPLDQPQQVPAKAPKPEVLSPAPEQVAQAPEPALAPAPEPIAPAPEPIAAPPAEAMATKEPTFEQDDGGLFPQIPLRAYKESDLKTASKPAPAPAVPGVEDVSKPYEPVGELDYGISKKGDTAWKVAEKLRPSEEISVYQIMMALQQSNPNAFVNGNIHRLKEGQVLRIDDPSLLTAMSKEQAAQQYQSQTQAWEEYLTSVGAEVPRQAIVAGGQERVDTAGGPPSGELTLASPRSEDASAGAGTEASASGVDSDVLRAQVRQAMQEADSERSRNVQLQARLNDLETELKRLENLVNIKDSDLASLQRKLEEMNAQRGAVTADTKTKKPKPAAEPEPEPVPEPTPAPVAEQPDAIQAPEPTPEPSAIEAQIEAATQTDTAQVEPPVPDGAEITPPAPVVEPVAPLTPAPAPSKAPSDGGGIMGTISGILGAVGGVFAGLGGTTMIIIIGVVAVVVILLVFIMIRRRRGIHFQESILNTGANEPQSVQMDMTPSQGSSLMGGESSFLSDFAISGVSAIQAEDSEVDPLTEADVFMAYGRYEAAEERLQEAIAQDPARGELRVKLLELYNTTKNKNSFETAAEDFYAALGDGAASNPLWQKVIAMGKQIAPGNPLFRGKAAAGIDATPTTDTANLNQNDVMDIGLDTGVFSNSEFNPINTGNTANAAEAYTSGGDLDFNLDMSTNTSDTSTDGGLDFALDSDDKSSGLDFNLDTNTSGSSDAETLDSISGGGAGFDFNLNTESHTENTKMAKNASDDSMEFSLDMNAGDEPTATDIKLNMGKSSSSSMDFDLELDEDTSPEIGMDMNLDAGDAMDLDMSDTGDEVGTKLDLARAYIDMGDPDGARSILDEVMAEGNPGQKQEAQQLMSQIG